LEYFWSSLNAVGKALIMDDSDETRTQRRRAWVRVIKMNPDAPSGGRNDESLMPAGRLS
jgi:hypothetical protein